MKKILIIFFFVAACGYQPLYIQKEEFSFKKINLIGDKQINRKIISISKIKKNTENNSNSELILETNKDIITTSRNSKGQPATFKSLIEVKFTVKDGDKILKQKIFSESFDYNNIENKYDLSVYQTDVEDNLIKQITEDLIIYMNIK
tara:strand:- start:15 stop:455 length:441 start_codon:yes stop_codon:yes gene_type:complete